MRILTIFLILFFSFCIRAQNHWYVDSITARDGLKLAVDVYVPDTTAGQTYPTILIQTPYNRLFYRINLPLGFGTQTQNMPFAFVTLDWRCFYGSAAACNINMDRGKDGYDAVEWIASQAWSNGKVGTWGPSALGRIQYLTAKEKPPHLTCAVPLVAGPQYNYQEYYPGGVLRKEYVETLDALGFGLSATLLAHQVFDIFWQYSENSTFYPSLIDVPLLMIGGWYDHNIDAMLEFFKGLKLSAPLSVRQKHKLLFGPWAHGGFGTAQVGTGQQGQLFYPEAAGWSDSLALMFFDYYLRDVSNGWDTIADYMYFQIGDNNWVFTSEYPPPDTVYHNFYLNTDGTLTLNMPIDTTNDVTIAYNPEDPSPTVGGATLAQGLGQGPYDQAPVVEARNDISIFDFNVISNPVVLKGKPSVTLKVSSNRTDTDFMVRITDVYPDGRSMLILEGSARMRFRNGFSTADTSLIMPGNIYPVTIDLPYTAYTFLPGHKIRLDITSSNYPRFALNLNNGGAMYVSGDTLMAQNKIYTNNYNFSFVKFPLIDFTNHIETEFTELISDFNIYPNPANKILNVELNNNYINSSIYLNIINILGITVYSEHNIKGKSFSISLSELESGMYFIKIFQGEKASIKSFIKY